MPEINPVDDWVLVENDDGTSPGTPLPAAQNAAPTSPIDDFTDLIPLTPLPSRASSSSPGVATPSSSSAASVVQPDKIYNNNINTTAFPFRRGPIKACHGTCKVRELELALSAAYKELTNLSGDDAIAWMLSDDIPTTSKSGGSNGSQREVTGEIDAVFVVSALQSAAASLGLDDGDAVRWRVVVTHYAAHSSSSSWSSSSGGEEQEPRSAAAVWPTVKQHVSEEKRKIGRHQTREEYKELFGLSSSSSSPNYKPVAAGAGAGAGANITLTPTAAAAASAASVPDNRNTDDDDSTAATKEENDSSRPARPGTPRPVWRRPDEYPYAVSAAATLQSLDIPLSHRTRSP